MPSRNKDDKTSPAVWRLLDANLNRAREGLRVVEDTARFIWNDAILYRRLRSLRHALHGITAASYRKMLEARESRLDAGRTLVEGSRQSIKALVSANLRRAQEAVRVLEEYSKVFSPKAAGEFKKIRYQIYQLEKRIVRKS